ncbi:DUF308 domain-containing protein [Roseisolibacter sp. H3M3-2]|uniref:DUF308 domain-containing protein n=1 Tax=Roseisolibacter sp. H3M3-2 TaxID=3031323 RepID=UPI0023DA3F41|nr:DUF308 domain-containing protein [Roseisolibacter sp. H3M3-2]MDF1503159.1 DUF308 domain-containing protein [Roseisolibacter sp. H3M3-2]
MAELLVRNWWAVAARGGAAAILALFVPFYPGLTLDHVIGGFAAYAFADGVLAVIGALKPAGRDRRAAPRREALLYEALAGLGLGILAALWPAPTLAEFEGLVAAWALATGALKGLVAWRLRGRLPAARLYDAAGAVGLLLGARLVVGLALGVVDVTWWLAGYAAAAALLLVAHAAAPRARHRTRLPHVPPAPDADAPRALHEEARGARA